MFLLLCKIIFFYTKKKSIFTQIIFRCIDGKVSRLLMQHPITQFDGGLKTKIKVFRFDGSRRVRILCSVDICIEECLPVHISLIWIFNGEIEIGSGNFLNEIERKEVKKIVNKFYLFSENKFRHKFDIFYSIKRKTK